MNSYFCSSLLKTLIKVSKTHKLVYEVVIVVQLLFQDFSRLAGLAKTHPVKWGEERWMYLEQFA